MTKADQFELCFEQNKIRLPRGARFGITAMTGDMPGIYIYLHNKRFYSCEKIPYVYHNALKILIF